MTAPRVEAGTAASARPIEGILWMALTSVLFVVMDAIAKSLTIDYPVNQITWARFSFHALFIALYLNLRLPSMLKSAVLGLQLLRSSFMLMTNFLFFGGLVWLGLAEISAIMYVTPLITTLLSVPVLGEQVGWRRLLSVLAGLIGAVVIIRPGGEAFSWALLFPLAAALSHSGYQLTTRLVARRDHALTTLCYTAIVGMVVSTLALPLGWVTPDISGWLRFAAIGLVGCLSHFTFIKAFTTANAAVVAPFGYLSLLWATIIGFFLFAEIPDTWTFVGAAIIAGSGLYILHRERAKKRRPIAAWRPSR
jgi:drug/metabolite transporter (DMT)-like permease